MSEADAVLLPARINIPLRVTSFLWLFSSALRDRSVSARLTGMGETPGKVLSWAGGVLILCDNTTERVALLGGQLYDNTTRFFFLV